MKKEISPLEVKDICEIVDFKDSSGILENKGAASLIFIPEKYGDEKKLVHRSETGDFSKWLQSNHPGVKLEVKNADQRLVLRSGDYWMPLAYLVANDVALPIYLNMVASYLYDRMKGALKGEKARVRLSALYKDKKAGTIKRFNFEGDSDSLQEAIKKFDLNDFFNG